MKARSYVIIILSVTSLIISITIFLYLYNDSYENNNKSALYQIEQSTWQINQRFVELFEQVNLQSEAALSLPTLDSLNDFIQFGLEEEATHYKNIICDYFEKYYSDLNYIMSYHIFSDYFSLMSKTNSQYTKFAIKKHNKKRQIKYQFSDNLKSVRLFSQKYNRKLITEISLKEFSQNLIYDNHHLCLNIFVHDTMIFQSHSCLNERPYKKHRTNLSSFQEISVGVDLYKGSLLEIKIATVKKTLPPTIIFLLFMILLSHIMSKLISHPINQLIESIKNISDLEVLKSHLDQNRFNISELSHIKNSFLFLAKKVTHFNKRDAEREKNKILYNLCHQVIHDIQSPLITLKVLNSESTKDKKKLISRSIERIESISSTLLKTTKQNKSKLERKTDIHYELSRVSEEYAILNKEIILPHSQNKKSTVNIAPNLFYRVIITLLNNSFDASVLQPALKIKHYQSKESHTLKIIDKGTGISKKNIKNIFTSGWTSKPNGQGIGLAQVKKILYEHNSHIEIRSIEGFGTVTTLFFPKA